MILKVHRFKKKKMSEVDMMYWYDNKTINENVEFIY